MAKRKGRTKGTPSKKQGGKSNGGGGHQFRSPRGIDRAVMDEYESLTAGCMLQASSSPSSFSFL